MDQNENLKGERYVTSECGNCGLPVADTGIDANPSGDLVNTCSCGLETRNCKHPIGGVDHASLRKYEMVIGKSEEQLVNELLSEIEVSSSNNIIRVGSFNIYKYREKNHYAIKKAMRMVLENKLNICGIQEFITYNDFNACEVSKIPGAYNYVEFYPVFSSDSASGAAIVSHHTMYGTTGGVYNEKPDTYDQAYIKTTIKINNKDVSIYNTHFHYMDGDPVKNQMLELATIIKSDSTPYKIVVADFNTRTLGTFKPLTDIGFKLAFDINDPNNNMQDGKTTIDNVLFSSNIELITSYKVPTPDYVTDHDLACAELKLL
jgi:hypothetical protein